MTHEEQQTRESIERGSGRPALTMSPLTGYRHYSRLQRISDSRRYFGRRHILFANSSSRRLRLLIRVSSHVANSWNSRFKFNALCLSIALCFLYHGPFEIGGLSFFVSNVRFPIVCRAACWPPDPKHFHRHGLLSERSLQRTHSLTDITKRELSGIGGRRPTYTFPSLPKVCGDAGHYHWDAPAL